MTSTCYYALSLSALERSLSGVLVSTRRALTWAAHLSHPSADASKAPGDAVFLVGDDLGETEPGKSRHRDQRGLLWRRVHDSTNCCRFGAEVEACSAARHDAEQASATKLAAPLLPSALKEHRRRPSDGQQQGQTAERTHPAFNSRDLAAAPTRRSKVHAGPVFSS